MRKRELMVYRTFPDGRDGLLARMEDIVERSEERRVGKECAA